MEVRGLSESFRKYYCTDLYSCTGSSNLLYCHYHVSVGRAIADLFTCHGHISPPGAKRPRGQGQRGATRTFLIWMTVVFLDRVRSPPPAAHERLWRGGWVPSSPREARGIVGLAHSINWPPAVHRLEVVCVPAVRPLHGATEVQL
jgi:hypothetical protein